MNSKSCWLVVMLVGVAIVAAGCGPGGRGLPTAKVTGTVTYKAKSLPEGKIIFQHSSGEMTATPFGADGKYELDVAVGKNKVMVQSLVSSEGKAGPNSNKTMEIFENRVPDRYSDFETSKLEVDVPESGTTFDVSIVK